ncbi:MAG TPA: hypothetical protein VJ724_06950 [Tahibacter sp.]|nr:hypothetical protein [Tahibacter sp.]
MNAAAAKSPEVHLVREVRLGANKGVDLFPVKARTREASTQILSRLDVGSLLYVVVVNSQRVARSEKRSGARIFRTVMDALTEGRRSIPVAALDDGPPSIEASQLERRLAEFLTQEPSEFIVYRADGDRISLVGPNETPEDALAGLSMMLEHWLGDAASDSTVLRQHPETDSGAARLERVARKRREIVESHEWLDSDRVADLLGSGASPAADAQRVKDARRRGQLLGVWHAGQFLHPVFQFQPSTAALYPQIKSILRFLPKDKTGWAQAFWFFQGHEALNGKSPADLFQEMPERIVELAGREGLRDDGSW